MATSTRKTTQDDALDVGSRRERRKAPTPGLVLVFSVDRPRCDVFPLKNGELALGRDDLAGVSLDDPQMSRRHVRVGYVAGRWDVEDLGSRNGTWVDGKPLTGKRAGAALRVVRAGSSVFLLAGDVEPLRAAGVTAGGTVLGPALVRVWDAIARAARFGSTLHITGESGTGKEHAARAFHALGPRGDGPFVAVNCAAIPEGLAERLLFGARKGAYSGATADADGYVQAARGGVLFLDEIAELDLGVQAKLLRTLETREVIPLGASRPATVDFALVSATHKDLRARVAAGELREDLFFRIARPEVRLPRLRDRLEEIPWLVCAAIKEADAAAAQEDGEGGMPLRAHASLIEACLRRAWPGNVRELLAESRMAAQEARSEASAWVEATHLSPSAGQDFPSAPSPSAPPAAAGVRAGRATSLPPDTVIEEALRREGGKVARAARVLGIHRTQLRRWLARRAE
ncbi:sigma-54 dependent transcriptional regulator [Sorangium cellulosum]|uniref:Sigma-54 dependent transcriptional regulator n=1 Tax=Sorangium cellulosum TaxID=56 RepID=A0A2L0F278_SORCE|nr:sigma 54-interacting transcriptional regulator [Sorangium cellulosum]AUX45569.1 sigma-54 dependent transcriptional regulator [Sorangium cellulosum]